MAMTPVEALHGLGVALAIGLLIGVERHWRERDDAPGQRTAGVRSFAVIGLLGGLAATVGAMSPRPDWAVPALIGTGFLALSLALILFKLREARAEGSFSVTTVLVGQATFLLGALALEGDLQVAAGAAVALIALLASRELLHGLVERLTWPELRAAILLLSMTLVVLPLIPDRRIDMLGGLNPARIWFFAVVLAAVSFVGYVATRVVGSSRGLLLAGAAAGLVSSTAAVIANARRAREGAAYTLAASALVASAVSYARTGLFAAGLAPGLREQLLVPLIAAALAQAGIAALLVRRDGTASADDAAPGNPFELRSVLKVALLLAVVGLVAELAAARFGDAGLYAVAALSGLADVDAVTLSVAALPAERIAQAAAGIAILIAVVSNTVAKTGYALWLGGVRYGIAYGIGSLIALAVCFGTLLGGRFIA